MKVKIVKKVKRSDGLWRFACGDVFTLALLWTNIRYGWPSGSKVCFSFLPSFFSQPQFKPSDIFSIRYIQPHCIIHNWYVLPSILLCGRVKNIHYSDLIRYDTTVSCLTDMCSHQLCCVVVSTWHCQEHPWFQPHPIWQNYIIYDWYELSPILLSCFVSS